MKRVPLMYGPECDWIDELQPGDIVMSGRGTERIVREAKAKTTSADPYKARVYWVSFVILRCSWTHRPVTVLSRNDLRILGYRPLGVSVPVRSRMDREIAREVRCETWPKVRCCDVRGLR